MKKILFILVLFCNSAYGQIKATHFNAEWNKSNGLWILKSVKLKDMLI